MARVAHKVIHRLGGQRPFVINFHDLSEVCGGKTERLPSKSLRAAWARLPAIRVALYREPCSSLCTENIPKGSQGRALRRPVRHGKDHLIEGAGGIHRVAFQCGIGRTGATQHFFLRSGTVQEATAGMNAVAGCQNLSHSEGTLRGIQAAWRGSALSCKSTWMLA